jgi:hypothetical protein
MHGVLRHRARDCLLPRRSPLRPSRPQLDVRVLPRDHSPDDQPLSTTTTGHLDLTLSTSDTLAMVALATAKSTIKVALRVGDDNFTLEPVSPKMFVASFRSRELRDRASTVSVSHEWPPVSTSRVEVPAVQVPLREALTGIGPMDEATASPPPHSSGHGDPSG